MKRLAEAVFCLSTISAYTGIVLSLLLLLLILAEIFSRTFLHTSLLLTLQVSSWLLIALVFMGAAWTLKADGHIQIKLIVSRFSPRAQHWITICIATVGMVAFSFFSVYTWLALVENYVGGMVGDTVYRLPKWWAWVGVVVGSIVMAMQFGGIILKSVLCLKGLGERKRGDIIPAFVVGLILVFFVLRSLFWSTLSGMGAGMTLFVLLIILFALIGSSLWIFLSLGLTGLLGLMLFTDYPPGELVAQVAFSANQSFVMTCLPLFIFMGELLFSSGASEDLYSGIGPWVGWIPGRLLHSNILSCTVFAAVSGSSAVTTATVGSVAVPELKKLGYDDGITLGSLAGAGTLGLLIPPSIAMIVYGAITEQSIGQLFIGGIFPGLMLSVLFMFYIGMRAIRNPSIAPASRTSSWIEMVKSTTKIIPIVCIIMLILGLIYTGITTPTEAGAIGALCAVIITLLYNNLNWENVRKASFATIRTTCMIMFVVTGAAILSSALAYLRVPQQLATVIAAAGLPKYLVLAIICIIYLILGCIFEGISMMVLTLPIVYPLILKLGFDGIWFGIVLVMLIEAAQITPPVGFNLYVLQNISGASVGLIVKNTIPFFIIMLVALLVLVLFPDIALFLPRLMIG